MEQFGERPFKVVANLPFYITTPIIMLFLDSGLPVELLTLMVQKEVADRLVAPPGGKEYGAVSVAVQFSAFAERMFLVPPEAFSPPPSVQSAVLNLVMRQAPAVDVTDDALFRKTVKGCFASRRKTLRNNIITTFGVSGEDAAVLLHQAGLDPALRAERLTLSQFAALANCLCAAGFTAQQTIME
jgi:16S rRNA (adenine1518-N6/adenine1519-N6)-dimethyltransferase